MSFTTINDKPTAALRNQAEWAAHEGKQGRRLERQRQAYEEPTVGDTQDDMDTNVLITEVDHDSNHHEKGRAR